MPLSKKPVGRLPAHLAHLKKPRVAEEPADGPGRTRTGGGTARVTPATTPRTDAAAAPATNAPDRLTSLVPEILRAMFPPGVDWGERTPVVSQEDVLAAFAPYYRPKSRFERLMIAKLVGEGYLRPRGARDKSGMSDAYVLTPKGERTLVGGVTGAGKGAGARPRRP
ncbi:hypothetical protein [Deinococcus pimensis]|uniref:hypothetical protein n=1 Tax=Deinococcus pimensis TaxID=309888 RepID=UPI00047F02EF|nr:hypothetical protein [Deinococcus pimensis]